MLPIFLLGSVALIWHVHGDPDHLRALGAWAHPLEVAAVISTAVQAWAVFRRIRGGGRAGRKAESEGAGRRYETDGAIAERPARLAFCVFALAWLSMLTHPWAQGAVYYTLVIALGVYAWLVSMRRRRPALELIAFNLGLTFVGAELALRALGLFVHSPLLAIASSDASEWLAANKLPPGQLRFGFPINSRGFYDDEFVKKPAGGCLVTAIGDSFTLGVVPHDWHFAQVAERALGCPVDAFGVGAVGPEEYLLMEPDAIALDPDAVVIDLFVGNDLVENLRGRDRLRGGLRALFDRENLLAYAVPSRLVALAAHRAPPPPPAPPEPMTREEVLAAFPWVTDPLREPQGASHAWYVQKEARNAVEYGGGDDAVYYARFETLMRRMRALAAGRVFVVMLIPAEPQVEDWLWSELHVRADRDRPQRLLGAWLKAEGIPTLDLLPLLRAVAPMPDGRRHLYQLDDSHLNARGNQVAGRALADFLRPLLRR